MNFDDKANHLILIRILITVIVILIKFIKGNPFKGWCEMCALVISGGSVRFN